MLVCLWEIPMVCGRTDFKRIPKKQDCILKKVRKKERKQQKKLL